MLRLELRMTKSNFFVSNLETFARRTPGCGLGVIEHRRYNWRSKVGVSITYAAFINTLWGKELVSTGDEFSFYCHRILVKYAGSYKAQP